MANATESSGVSLLVGEAACDSRVTTPFGQRLAQMLLTASRNRVINARSHQPPTFRSSQIQPASPSQPRNSRGSPADVAAQQD
jgi:hypothetical protein